ncbi:cordon-bleu protein-like 1 [Lethenteron reissneri]|uniref:cordon-bleu protein-like 1 n=1 Tax=Lethenteron reissneri TaxID=7753 RepID=UPI002AB641F6|nr:cordon-bleu protein-like 1 [Lethenteron reissneri]
MGVLLVVAATGFLLCRNDVWMDDCPPASTSLPPATHDPPSTRTSIGSAATPSDGFLAALLRPAPGGPTGPPAGRGAPPRAGRGAPPRAGRGAPPRAGRGAPPRAGRPTSERTAARWRRAACESAARKAAAAAAAAAGLGPRGESGAVPSASPHRHFPVSLKTKPRAPLAPPMSQSETEPPNLDPPDLGGGGALPVENVELGVILPGGERHVSRFHGSKPVMDVLVVLCGRYRLSPAGHTLELLSRDDASPLRYKPHTPLGALGAGTALIKPRPASDDRLKKPTQPVVVPEVEKSHFRFDPCAGSRKECFKVEPVRCTQELSHGLHDNTDLPAKKTKGLFSFLWPKKKKTSMPGTPLMGQQQQQHQRPMSMPCVPSPMPGTLPSGGGGGGGKQRAPGAPVSPTNPLATIPEDEEPDKDNVPSVPPGRQESGFELSSPDQPRLAPETRRSQPPAAPLAASSTEATTAAAESTPPSSPPPRSAPEHSLAAFSQPGSSSPVTPSAEKQRRRRSSSTGELSRAHIFNFEFCYQAL